MNLLKIALILSAICSFGLLADAQTKPKTPVTNTSNSISQVKSSPAYAEVLLRKTEILSEVESLLVDYTEEYPKVAEMRYESGLLQKEMDRLATVNAAESSKLTTALGKLMVRKCELETDLWALLKQFNDQHPDVKRAKRKVEIFESAINDILQGK